MADGTRLKDLYEAQKKWDQILQDETMKREATEMKLQDQITGIFGKFEHLTQTLGNMQLQLSNLGEGSILGSYQSGGSTKTKFMGDHSVSNVISHILKVDFPRFDGSNPRSWILKCQGYFKLIPNIPDKQRVILATMHFDGKAALWYQNLSQRYPDLGWDQFLQLVSARFEELRDAKIIVEFNKLSQEGSYEDYVAKFEELRACLELTNKVEFPEGYFVASFASGLHTELQAAVKMFNPKTLEEAIELDRHQQLILETLSRKMKTINKNYTPHVTQGRRMEGNVTTPARNFNPSSIPPQQYLTKAQMAQRREQGLCYNCDEKFVPGHRCKNRISYVIMTEEEEESLDNQLIKEVTELTEGMQERK